MMIIIGLILLCGGGIIYTIIPLLSAKLISAGFIIVGYIMVKYSRSDITTKYLEVNHGKRLQRLHIESKNRID